jgi:hypothetical protein
MADGRRQASSGRTRRAAGFATAPRSGALELVGHPPQSGREPIESGYEHGPQRGEVLEKRSDRLGAQVEDVQVPKQMAKGPERVESGPRLGRHEGGADAGDVVAQLTEKARMPGRPGRQHAVEGFGDVAHQALERRVEAVQETACPHQGKKVVGRTPEPLQ